MGQRSTVMFTTGAAGSGKSYCRCAKFLLTELLPNSEHVHISNYPIQFEPWVDGAGQAREGLIALAGDMLGMEEQTVRARVEVIPQEETQRWRNEHLVKGKAGQELHGPWHYFHDRDLSGVHLAIDEIHNYCGVHSSPMVKREWQKWLGELRHRGATIEFLSQHEAKVDKVIQQEAEIRLVLIPQEQRPDPIFGIKLYYWYNLWAKLTGMWRPSVWLCEERQVRGKWVEESRERWYYDARLFGVYDSWSTPVAGGVAGTTGKKEYQTKSWPALLLWFFWAAPGLICSRLFLATALFLLFWFRKTLIAGYFSSMFLFGPNPEVAKLAEGQGSASPPVTFDGQPVTFEGRAVVPEVVPLMVQRLDEAETQLVEANEASRNATERLAAIEERLQTAFAIGGLTREEVFFRAGCSYRIGEIIEFGPYDGLKVERIDYARRLVFLSEGRVLRMGLGDGRVSPADWLQDVGAGKAGAGSTASSVPGPLQSSSGPATATPGVGPVRKNGQPINGGNAVGGVRPDHGRPSPVLNRAGAVARPETGNGGTGGRSAR